MAPKTDEKYCNFENKLIFDDNNSEGQI